MSVLGGHRRCRCCCCCSGTWLMGHEMKSHRPTPPLSPLCPNCPVVVGSVTGFAATSQLLAFASASTPLDTCNKPRSLRSSPSQGPRIAKSNALPHKTRVRRSQTSQTSPTSPPFLILILILIPSHSPPNPHPEYLFRTTCHTLTRLFDLCRIIRTLGGLCGACVVSCGVSVMCFSAVAGG
jgi:hypothetical protein